jgi:glycosyltransferase involved in cell wall biosynthesis
MALRIVVCTSQVPLIYGGAEVLADALVEQLRLRGHSVDMVRIPMRDHPREVILPGYLAWRLINLEASEGRLIDRVIALKFPSYVVSHPCKVTWLVHQYRQLYDLHGTEYSVFRDSPEDSELRATITRIDTHTLGESKRLLAISRNVADRLYRNNGLKAEVLYPPPAMDGHFQNGGYGDYILSVSRLDLLKRLDLLIRAMREVKTPMRCLIAGRGPEMGNLQHLARSLDVEDRVDFLGFVPDQQVLELYARARAVFYAPVDEDYGLATVEAMKSGKAVVTAHDSGGVLEFVEDGVTGRIVSAESPSALASFIDELYEDGGLAERLGLAAQARVADITWDRTIQRLLE